jgi:ABC-type polysaccharide/polyol phosphate transport system ATPase subunit
MYAIQAKDMGVKFILHHQKSNTLLETIIRFVKGQSNGDPSRVPSTETFWALRNISFSVKKGESFGIIGQNGAGKSTLLQLITGIYKPDEGSVIKDGSIGLLQLGTGFHPELSGRDNIYIGGAILGFKKEEIDAMFHDIIEFSELERFIDTPIKNYSSGMLARLGFSIAINIQPDIFLIDEVLAVGDDNFKKKCRLKLEEIREKGKTIVFVSHALGEVQNLCDRAICLDRGQILYEGSSPDAIRFYREQILKEKALKV